MPVRLRPEHIAWLDQQCADTYANRGEALRAVLNEAMARDRRRRRTLQRRLQQQGEGAAA
jgi:Arc/MetJ-type ribon-helix-helix transcriptional regulator